MKPNKSGYYRATFTIKDSTGKPKRIEIYDKDPDNLQKRVIEKKYAYSNGLLTINGNSLVEKWAYEWLETYKTDVLDKQLKRYKGIINNYIVPEIGSLSLKEVNTHHIQKVLNNCKGMSTSHINVLYNTLNGMFTKATVSRMIPYNPCSGAIKPMGTKGKLRALTPSEEQAFLKAAEKHHRGMMFKMTLFCGLRPGEVRALKWEDVNFKTKRILVESAVESGKKQIKSTKTDSGVRYIPIPIDYLNELKLKSKDNGLVFPSNATGGILTEQGYKRSWNSFKRLMDIELGAKVYRNEVVDSKIDTKLTPYYLRHTYCTHLAEKGIDLKTAQYLMGHSDIKVTAEIYTHVTNVMLENAANIIQRGNNVGKRKFRLSKSHK